MTFGSMFVAEGRGSRGGRRRSRGGTGMTGHGMDPKQQVRELARRKGSLTP